MKTDTKTDIHNEMISSPLVRIDALDENYVEPIREFFALNGCQVYINSSPGAYPTYHIVVGDIAFVKYILDSHKITSQKTISIVWNTQESDIENLHIAFSKFALIDPKALTANVIEDLFNYFFTGTQKIKSFQTTTPNQGTKVENQELQFEKRPKQREPAKEKVSVEQGDTQRIAHAISQIFTPNKTEKTKHLQANPSPHKHMHIRTYMFLSILALLLPIIWYFFSLTVMVSIVYRQTVCITKNIQVCKITNEALHPWSTNARQVLPYVQIPFTLLRINSVANENIITALEKMSSTIASSAEVEQIASDFSKSFFTTDLSKEDTTATVVQIDKIKTQLFSLHTNLDMSYRLIEKIMENPPFPLSLPAIKIRMEKGMDTIRTMRTRLQTAERLLLLYPYIAGYKTPLNLLFLFQNNTELRPTGGFIGSIMQASIEDGTITTMDVQDVYAVDGQLRGHIDPPAPIRDILAQEHWYLRDSNWDPNFEESAQRAMWFYEKETGKTVQGVIAVNSSLIIQILKLLGSIQMPETQDIITADNFYEKSLAYTQTDFFPGSTQKKDFLGSLMNVLMTSLLENKKLSGIQTFSIIDEALKNRNIQMYFVDPEAQQLSKQFIWAGILPSKTYCLDIQTPCLFDYSTIIEANLGVNKANYYIKRDDVRDITITEGTGKITETITRTVTNTANTQITNGVYKNYIRFYVPKAARITNFTMDSLSIPAKPTKKNTPLSYPYGELDTTSPDFSVISVASTLAQGQKTTISLSYEYTENFTTISPLFDLHIFGQKQSGIDEVPTIIRIHYPTTWKLGNNTETTSTTLANEGYLEYNSTMSEDSDIQMHFIKE